MSTNLRSAPIEGYITDNAGNIQRNTDIVIKQDAPNGSIIVDTVKSDDDGYFVSKPIKNGPYDIYESGIRVYRVYNSAQPSILQCYAPGTYNAPINLPTFASYTESTDPDVDINDFRQYLQIEPETIDIQTYGHQFPLWIPDQSKTPSSLLTDLALIDHPFKSIATVHPEITAESRLTHTRFDVEYFLPMSATNIAHRRIRWTGIPGIMFYNGSKIVLPLDYYSIVPNQPNMSIAGDWEWEAVSGNNFTTKKIKITLDGSASTFFSYLSKGDILEVSFGSDKAWVIVYYTESTRVIYGMLWRSHYAVPYITDTADMSIYNNVSKIVCYQAIWSAIQNISQSTSEQFTVIENTAAQNRYNNSTERCELYDYDGAAL